MAAATSTEFGIASFTKSPGRNMPQNLARMLWCPLARVAASGFAAGCGGADNRAYESGGLYGVGA